MTHKNIFVYKLFLSLNISDFSLFLCKNCNAPPPLKKITLSKQSSSKNGDTVRAPLFENFLGGSTPTLCFPFKKYFACPISVI